MKNKLDAPLLRLSFCFFKQTKTPLARISAIIYKMFWPFSRRTGQAWLPVTMAVLALSTFITSYLMAASYHNVSLFFPYISDTGAMVPESCVFTLLLTLTGILAAGVIYVRYLQVREYNREDVRRVLGLNLWALRLGLAAVLGLLVVAAFQDTAVLMVHFAGAALCFGSGLIYCILCPILSFRLSGTGGAGGGEFGSSGGSGGGGSRCLRVSRAIMTVSLALSLGGFGLFALLAYQAAPTIEEMKAANCTGAIPWNGLPDGLGRHGNHSWPGIWPPCEGGFAFHVTSAFCEWSAALLFVGYLLSYYRDFQRLHTRATVRLNSFDIMYLSSSNSGGQGGGDSALAFDGDKSAMALLP